MHDVRVGVSEPEARTAQADELVGQRRFLDAAKALEQVPAADRPAALDVRIVELRHRAYAKLKPSEPSRPPAEDPPDLFPGVIDAPEVPTAELSNAVLRSALHHHGCLLVRGLVDEHVAEQLRADIDRAFDGIDRKCAGASLDETTPWYRPLQPRFGGEALDPVAEVFLRTCGGVYAASSPRSFVRYLDVLTKAGVIDLVRSHFREPPVLSLNKCVLRRIGGGAEPSWHQDTSYLGTELKAVNLWLSLSHCGGETDVMGLDILPQRMDGLAEMGTHGAAHHQAIAQEVVDELREGRPTVRPEFQPGDGLLFDHLFVHRSDIRPLPTERYAIESWFFGPSTYPANQVPIVAV